jgi:hypothetical protein
MTQQYTEPDEEIWESQVPGRTWVETRDYDGRPRNLSVVGIGSRLRLRSPDRIRVQERLQSEALDPFKNGTLIRIDKEQSEDPMTASPDALSNEELQSIFALDLDDFREYVSSLGEVNLRRLKVMAPEVDASLNQTKFVDELIAERYPLGGDTPTYREMMAGPNTPV